jgi:hypothetical protein
MDLKTKPPPGRVGKPQLGGAAHSLRFQNSRPHKPDPLGLGARGQLLNRIGNTVVSSQSGKNPKHGSAI